MLITALGCTLSTALVIFSPYNESLPNHSLIAAFVCLFVPLQVIVILSAYTQFIKPHVKYRDKERKRKSHS